MKFVSGHFNEVGEGGLLDNTYVRPVNAMSPIRNGRQFDDNPYKFKCVYVKVVYFASN